MGLLRLEKRRLTGHLIHVYKETVEAMTNPGAVAVSERTRQLAQTDI